MTEYLDEELLIDYSHDQKRLKKSESLTNLSALDIGCHMTGSLAGHSSTEADSFEAVADRSSKHKVDGSKPDMKLCSSVVKSIQEKDHYHEQDNYEVQSILFPETRETLPLLKRHCISRSSSSGKSSSYSPLRLSVTFTNTKRGNRQTETPSISGADLTIHQLAAQGDRVMLVERLMQGTDVDEQDDMKYTALMWACANDQRDVVNVLLQAGADERMYGQDGETALSFAVNAGSFDIVNTLCKSGADVNAYDWNGGTPLMYAVHGDHAECADVLLFYGADMIQENESGVTPYSLAVTLGNPRVLKVLEDHLMSLLQSGCSSKT
ncbi:ankyrin repeat family A protein 2-like [Anneissia japonica]|uniref:ankyrin repeat family A protein 2-like n=1 Tax=Anneissia japonica TaxID=1529436 RepID=UPI0014255504|nr:ankyrin repeat family A protein 2-like [Anneissia japonica]XP_033100776.1 ankyrin repeat family A protein 2-like [Anneissia japonica]